MIPSRPWFFVIAAAGAANIWPPCSLDHTTMLTAHVAGIHTDCQDDIQSEVSSASCLAAASASASAFLAQDFCTSSPSHVKKNSQIKSFELLLFYNSSLGGGGKAI